MFSVSSYFMLYFANQNAIQNVKFPEEMIGGLAHELFWVAFQQNSSNTISYTLRGKLKNYFCMHAREERSIKIIMYMKWLIAKKLTELCRALFIQSLKLHMRSKPFQTHSQPTFIIPRVPMKYRGKKQVQRSVKKHWQQDKIHRKKKRMKTLPCYRIAKHGVLTLQYSF